MMGHECKSPTTQQQPVFWPDLWQFFCCLLALPVFFLLLLPILEPWFYLGSRTTTMKMAWPCRVVSALHPCSAAQRHLTEEHLQLEGLWLTEETPEHETTRINKVSPHQLRINCAIKSESKSELHVFMLI